MDDLLKSVQTYKQDDKLPPLKAEYWEKMVKEFVKHQPSSYTKML